MTQEKTPDGSRGGMEVDAGLVRELAELLKETDLTEIEVQDGERRIRVARQMTLVAAAAPAAQAQPAAVAAPVATQTASDAADPASVPGMLPSPMVGTAFLSGEPGKPPFVTVGSQVAEGATLLIIEAMKVMNQITAPRAGTVTRIFITNGQAVEYGEPLMVIE
jgi:acetyl-CoA carboxylase biotin carboxyl carrier protein